jgi:hypothetical protein
MELKVGVVSGENDNVKSPETLEAKERGRRYLRDVSPRLI